MHSSSKFIIMSLLFLIVSIGVRGYDELQGDYSLKLIKTDEGISILMRCKLNLSCAVRLENAVQSAEWYQLEIVDNRPSLLRRASQTEYFKIPSKVGTDSQSIHALFQINANLPFTESAAAPISLQVSIIKDRKGERKKEHFSDILSLHQIRVQESLSSNELADDFFFVDSSAHSNQQVEESTQFPSLKQIIRTLQSSAALTVVKKAHSIALFIIWGFLVDISIICVRYFKAYKKYLRFHASVFAIGNVCSLIVVFIQMGQRSYEINNLSQQSSKEGAHFVFGLILAIVIIIQHFIGMITKLNLENENGSQTVHSIKRVHKYLGYFIYIIAKVNLIIGADLFEKTYFVKQVNDDYWWAKVIGGLYAIQISLLLFVEFLYRSEPEFLTKKKPLEPLCEDSDKKPAYPSIIEKLNNHVPIVEIKNLYPDIMFIVHENSVYDISEIQHPGGQFILKHIRGKEISRYFNGGYQCEQTTMQPYRHTLYARNFLRKFFIGDINNEYYNIFVPSEQSANFVSTQPQSYTWSQKDVWKLEESRTVNDIYKVFLFSNPNYLVRTYLPGVRWFGRNIVLTPQLDTMNIHSRNYCVVLAYFEENYRYRIELIKYFQYKLRDDLRMNSQMSNRTLIPPQHAEITNLVPFLIKRHENPQVSNGLSKFLHMEVHKQYHITEPIGHGLEITEQSDGDHIIFVAGTGILPFLDLFDYLLKKLIYTVIKGRFGDHEARLVNIYNEDYENAFGPNFRIKLYGAFTSKAECYGYQILSDLHTFCNEFQIPWFSTTVRFASQESDQFIPSTKQYFNAQFIDVALSMCNPTKILICGPPEFNKNISNILLVTRGLDESRVQIV